MANKSKTYLLPLLSELVNFDFKFFENLKNTFMYDDLGTYKDCLLILHDFSFKNPEYTKYEQTLIECEYFVDFIDINNQVLYIFKFPEEYMVEYNAYKEGNYSQFGRDAKEMIMSFYARIYKGNLGAINFLIKVKQVLFKSDTLKKKLEKELNVSISDKAELSDPMDVKKETFELSKYLKTVV